MPAGTRSCSSTATSEATTRTGEPFCGSGGYDPAKPMVTLCTTHAAYHEVFGTAQEFTTPYSSSDAPAMGAISVKRIKGTSIFDGWGYAHLYRRQAGKMTAVDSYAIPQGLNPAYAFGFGDLSIHEFASLDRGLGVGADHAVAGLKQLAFPAALVEVEDRAGLLKKLRVAREDPRALLPGLDRVVGQPATDR